MYCNYCGRQIQDDAVVCAYCARPVGATVPRRHLYRPVEGRKIGGVALGMAVYFGEDVMLVRLIWVLALLLTLPIAFILYIIAWIIIPEEPLRLPVATSTISSPSPQS
ncbi:MAG TPA: PspC domain-containing protein [Terriglobales bacterium]|nr:PspC domain-containing protein [Terriglobales bacterium]